MDNKNNAHTCLCELGLTNDQATTYLTLLEGPFSHLEIARCTGINRTKVYRIVEDLEKYGLASKKTDDRGTFVVASNPSSLEGYQASHEKEVSYQRSIISELVPDLMKQCQKTTQELAVQTYDGVEGVKQMQWNELKAKGELLVFGNVRIEDLVNGDQKWAKKFRELVSQEGYGIREIVNTSDTAQPPASNKDYLKLYNSHTVAAKNLPVETPFVIYNNTVAIYQLNDDRRIGVEIINARFAETMRRIFEHYWSISV